MPVGLHPNTSGLGTIETHVPTVWEYLWHFGGRPKCFFLKRSALILRKHMSIIRKRIAHMFHPQGPSASGDGTSAEPDEQASEGTRPFGDLHCHANFSEEI